MGGEQLEKNVEIGKANQQTHTIDIQRLKTVTGSAQQNLDSRPMDLSVYFGKSHVHIDKPDIMPNGSAIE
ncbi:hypothetical protein [uncultured Microbulbifer sp.]|uniref:hypothetical protein n=1 Tax=uncultured Microbulbifer sp. TaxID=348147 RepID=UPI00262C76E4|nr:hypothetical protein [uncultured Microbulbifer sp.]